MAIRFQCPACSEPIEVDLDWARRVVRCPYCQRTVTAPAESTLPAQDEIPVATAVPGRREFQSSSDPVAPSGSVPPYPPAAQTNRAALVAMILAGVTLVLWLLYFQTASAHRVEIQEFYGFLQKQSDAGTPSMTAMMKYTETQNGQLPAWMMTMSVLMVAGMATWIATVTFGIVGLFRPIRRAMAITALIIAGSLTGMCCLSALGGAGG